MKKILLFILALLCCYNLFSQSNVVSKDDSGMIHLSEVVQVPDQSKDEIYENCIIWASESISYPKDAIQSENQQVGLITIKSRILTNDEDFWWRFNMTIQIRDGRYKYDITNIAHCYSDKVKRIYSDVGLPTGDVPLEKADFVNKSLNWETEVYNLFSSLINSLKKKTSEDNNW